MACATAHRPGVIETTPHRKFAVMPMTNVTANVTTGAPANWAAMDNRSLCEKSATQCGWFLPVLIFGILFVSTCSLWLTERSSVRRHDRLVVAVHTDTTAAAKP